MKYRLFVPTQAVGASLVYFDLFNASGSNVELTLLSVKPIVSGAVAVTGVVAVDLYLTRTTAVGTGGTAATAEGTSLTAATLTALDCSQKLTPSVTARLTPTGGATAGAVLGLRSVYTEETNAGTYTMTDLVCEPVLIPEGTGFRVVQSSVASVGNIGYDVEFSVRMKAGS